MTIDFAARTIVLTKKERTAARRDGSDAYNELQNARRENPGYEIITVTRTVKTQRETYKGLTYAYMEKYIKSHGTKEEIDKNYADYKEQRERGECYTSVIAYGIIKDWFLEKYPEIEAFGKKKSKANNNSENESTEITIDEKKSA